MLHTASRLLIRSKLAKVTTCLKLSQQFIRAASWFELCITARGSVFHLNMGN